MKPTTIAVKKKDRLALMKLYFKSKGIAFETEYKFHPTRKWKFDLAFPKDKVAVEYEGIMSGKSRHTTTTGYSGDCEKYNEATVLGWRILRFTTINMSGAIKMIEKLLTN